MSYLNKHVPISLGPIQKCLSSRGDRPWYTNVAISGLLSKLRFANSTRIFSAYGLSRNSEGFHPIASAGSLVGSTLRPSSQEVLRWKVVDSHFDLLGAR